MAQASPTPCSILIWRGIPGVRGRLRARRWGGTAAAAFRARPLARWLGLGHDHSFEAMVAIGALQRVDRHSFPFARER
jgi:hypothetical protein